jgi:hypothetical protein
MVVEFSYNKNQVIQALRFHFISRPEIRIMVILVNVFALTCAILYYFNEITSFAVLFGSFMWFFLMISFWFVMPMMVYRRAATFQDSFTMRFEDEGFSVGTTRGSRSWPWQALSKFMESPHFFHLYFDSRSFFLVPKNSFKTSDEIFELRQLLKAKVKR